MDVQSPVSSPPGRAMCVHWLFAVLLVCTALNGCQQAEENSTSDSKTSIPDATQGSGLSSALPPTKPETLSPIIRTQGLEHVLPRGVVIELARAVVPEVDESERLKGTVINFSPKVPGALEWTGPSTLVFKPLEPGFAFEAEYTLTIEALRTKGGVVKPPSEGAWSHRFKTPSLRFLRLQPKLFDHKSRRVEVDLVFSGPVDPKSVQSLSTFFMGTRPIQGVKWLAEGARSLDTVGVELADEGFEHGATIRWALKEGLTSPSGSGIRAPSAGDSFELRNGKRLDITGVGRKAGATGIYLTVSCRDVGMEAPPSAPEIHEYEYWRDEDNGCLPVDASSIRLTPPVKVSVLPTRGGFLVMGDFKRGTYTLRIAGGMRSAGGGVLLSDFERDISIPALEPRLAFTLGGRYLPHSAWRTLPLQHRNLDEAELTIRHVPPENLIFWMSHRHGGSYALDARTSNLLLKKTLAFSSPQDTLTTTYLDVASLVSPATKGLVAVSVATEEQRDLASVLLTNLSLVAKRGAPSPGTTDEGTVWVWALGIESTLPLSGVDVTLVKKSGLILDRCVTQGEEGCVLRVPKPGVDERDPFALIARQGEELTYLRYDDLETKPSNADVHGETYGTESTYRGAIWSDRGVYRPGDTAHVAAVLRGAAHLAPPKGMPVEWVVVDPREQELKKGWLKTNEAGLVAFDLPFEAFQDTGRYHVSLRVAAREVGSYSFNVEEFVPERMEVSALIDARDSLLGEEVPVEVAATYLFGGSAEKSPVELRCTVSPTSFKPVENGEFVYGPSSAADEGQAFHSDTLGEAKGVLDEEGKVVLKCPGREDMGDVRGPMSLRAGVSVFEAGSGRLTRGFSSGRIHPERYYLGLQTDTKRVKEGRPVSVKGVVVDWNGKRIKASPSPAFVEVETLRLEEEYGGYYDEDDSQDFLERNLRALPESRFLAKVVGGRFNFTVTPEQNAAGYLVRVGSGRTRSDLVLEGQGRYHWRNTVSRVDQTPRRHTPTPLDVVVPREVRNGEPFTVKVKAPYRGRMLFTVETDRVLASEWKAVEPGEVTWTFTPKKFAPNLYVSALMVKDPHLESREAFMSERAFGVASVMMAPVDYTQAVAMRVPKEVRSNESLAVDLDLGPLDEPTFASVAVVDEGILSVTGFQSPNPLQKIFTKRALGVRTYETIGWTMLMPPGGSSRPAGGDAAGDASGRVRPIKPVALWSGVVRVPASGKLRLPFRLPQYRGAVRVMAVTAGPKRVGNASAKVLVKDPLVLQTTLPRFLTQNDEVQVPVFVTNLSGKAQDVKVTLRAESLPVPGLSGPVAATSPLQLLSKSEGLARVENGKSRTFVFQARAVQSVGAARLSVVVEGGGHTSKETLDVPLSPAGPRERRVQRIELAQGVTDVSKYLQGWTPTTERSTLWVTANPYAQSLQHLSYLARYPYGCIEQTTSSTRPLLFMSEMVDSIDPTLTGKGSVESMVLAGISRVLSMQTPSGGFGYWPGSTDAVPWGTAYATHMLLDAQKLKYPVPQERLNGALQWMGDSLNAIEGWGGHHRDAMGEAEAYMHYVLALSGKGRKARVQKLVDVLTEKQKAGPLSGQDLEAMYTLKAALWLSGDRRYEKELRSPDLSPVTDERKNSWSFYSDRRRRGFMLSTFQDLFGNDAAGEPLAAMVAESLQAQSSDWYTTQELVWGITGLGKRLKGASMQFAPPVLTVDGEQVVAQQSRASRASDRTWVLARASERNALQLDLPSKDSGKVYLVLSSEGVRSDSQARVGGQGLTLTRRYRKSDGSLLEPGKSPVALAALIHVELELRNTTAEVMRNIVLVDRLPAGWEIENARLGREVAVNWVAADALWKPDYVNIRDDRMEVFGALEAKESKTVVYSVRAVTAGTFTIPGAEAEAMYDSRVWAREPGGTAQVTGPWKDSLL
ncbi:alpha-2-macroglobulin family protein [Myxococcus stipitatus]|uniref:alpha-2-macroglobulin family protein n=1 Tax=Myxococcus stipitatus TaxID=83455 RepID=UPI0030CE2EF6